MNYLDIYEKSFNVTDYSNEYHFQYSYMLDILQKKYNSNDQFSVIDIGSGRGQLIKLIMTNFPNSKITSVDLKKFHKYDIHEFISCDLSKAADRDNVTGNYDVLLSTDVFEHLDKTFINDVINMCSRLSSTCLFAIANHSDILNGIELHTIQESMEWWNNVLSSSFKIDICESHSTNRLYTFQCSRKN